MAALSQATARLGGLHPVPCRKQSPSSSPVSSPVNILQIGVSFSNLHCHGFSTSKQHHLTFASYFLTIPRWAVAYFRPGSPSQKVPILDDFEGLILPGQMLLVLGRPGSGCSTFLKALAGNTDGFHIADQANVNYQGHSYRQMHRDFKGKRVYLAEYDSHFPELSLGQTLNFAVSTQERKPQPNAGRNVAALFRLESSSDTKIGNATIRGISGGEKRRTSIAEAFLSGAQVQCWDNSTRGLDSSTARRFVNLLRRATDTRRSTVLMSLYQASEEMYKTFDIVTLLYEGRQIYYGPTDVASSYFTSLGFVRPARATTADFLTSLSNPTERVVRPGYEDQVPRLPKEFAAIWKRSEEAKKLRTDIDAFNSTHPVGTNLPPRGLGSDVELASPRLQASSYPLTLTRQVSICLRRAFQRTRNSIGPVISSIVANSLLGLILGSVFYNLGEQTVSLQSREILLFFALTINAFAPAIEVSQMWAQRPIVEKHSRYAFYHPFTERLASLLNDMPAKIVTCFGLHTGLYFLANLRRTGSAFFTYWLFMFANLVTMSMLFRVVGSVSRTRESTMTPVSILSLLCIIYAGFIVPPDYMVPWLGWFWRINPVAYTYESLLINELSNREFICSILVPDGPSYTEVPLVERTCTTVGSDTGNAYVQGTTYLGLKYGYLPSHLWRNLGILFSMMSFLLLFHLLAAEYIPSQPSRGEVILFLDTREKSPSVIDEEAATANPTPLPEDPKHELEGESDAQPGVTANIANTPDQGRSLYWRNLSYDVKVRDGSRRILSDIDGWVQPGSLTALMGVTGAGKTTLLDVLAGRITVGKVTGEAHISGHSRDASFRRRVGYVQQEDINLPTATVREALQFSALLRQPSTKRTKEKLDDVEDVLRMMNMDHLANAVVGVPGEGLNIEQRKRLSIAVEMVAKPDLLLFLDEPTSGLDSQTAWSICTLLRKLVNDGQTILCTIHQPSSQLFCMFDCILLLDKTGEMLYFGDVGHEASTLVSYFERHGAPKCQDGDNPAEWMLEIVDKRGDAPIGSPEALTWPETWRASHENQAVQNKLDRYQNEPERPTEPSSAEFNHEYAASFGEQMVLVTRRIFQEQWRDPVYLYCKITLCIGLSLINGISFYNTPFDIQGLTSLLFSIFLITQLFGSIDRLIIPRFVSGRQLFESRERNSKLYSWVVLISSTVLVEIFWQTLVSIPIFASWYYPTGLQRNGSDEFGTAERGAATFILIWFFTLWVCTLSQVFAAGIEQAETAMNIVTLFFWLTLVFAGILVSPENLPRFWIFMYRVSPLTYFLEGLAAAGISGASVRCSSIETIEIALPSSLGYHTCGDYLEEYINDAGGFVVNPSATSDCQFCPVSNADAVLASLGMNTQHVWRNVGLIAVYISFNLVAIFAVYWLVRLPKKRKGDQAL